MKMLPPLGFSNDRGAADAEKAASLPKNIFGDKSGTFPLDWVCK